MTYSGRSWPRWRARRARQMRSVARTRARSNGVVADHRRLRMELFEVLDDRQRLGQVGAVVELQDRQPAERILPRNAGVRFCAADRCRPLRSASGCPSPRGRRAASSDWARAKSCRASSQYLPLARRSRRPRARREGRRRSRACAAEPSRGRRRFAIPQAADDGADRQMVRGAARPAAYCAPRAPPAPRAAAPRCGRARRAGSWTGTSARPGCGRSGDAGGAAARLGGRHSLKSPSRIERVRRR